MTSVDADDRAEAAVESGTVGNGSRATSSGAASDRERVAAPIHRPRVAGYRVTDCSALLGAAIWLGLVAASRPAPLPGSGAGTLALDLPELFVALAALAVVPLGFGVAATPTGTAERGAIASSAWYRLAVVAQPPCALAATAATVLPRGSTAGVALALAWLVPTGSAALAGALRLVARGRPSAEAGLPVEELAIDAALLYLPVSAVALVLHRAAVDVHFRPVIVLLTAVHYQYAGFVLPLVVGRVGRLLAARGRLPPLGGASASERDLPSLATTAATLVLVCNVALIAVGITFSPTVEVVAVALFAAAVLGFAAATLRSVVPTLPRAQGALLAVAFGTLFWTLALAVAYAYSAYPATGSVIGIGEMLVYHGVVNALGFAIPALLALRLRDAAS